jgi:hypothetical protein
MAVATWLWQHGCGNTAESVMDDTARNAQSGTLVVLPPAVLKTK